MARERVFTRARDGALRATLYPPEVELLAMTARDMVSVVDTPPDDVRDRLYPRAYLDPTEETAQQEYDALVHGDLVDARRAAFGAMADRLEHAEPNRRGLVELTLSADEELQWLTAINDARLVVGTALGVTEDEEAEYPPGDPRHEFGVLYAFLTGVHFDLVELMLGEIGEAGTDDAIEGGPDAGGRNS